MYTIPSLSALKQSHLQPTDAPSSVRERLTQWWQPWRIEFRQKIEGDPVRGLQHVVRITVRDGVVSKQRDMLQALGEKFDPIFRQQFTQMPNSGKLYTTCSDHTKSTLEWAYSRPYTGMMPSYGIPPTNAIPGGSPYMFFKLAFGEQPVELAEAYYTWKPMPGEAPTVSAETWMLERQGDVEEKDMSLFQRLSRGAGFGEEAGDENLPFGVRSSRR